MATIVLSAAGMALGGSIGGAVFGLSMATIGRAAGATLGRYIDQQLLGAGSEPVEAGHVDRFRLTGASEGAAVAHVYGRARVGGQVIWATRFTETTTTTGGGKGVGPQPTITEFSYSVSLAIAVCEGEISHVGRIWADGVEVAPADLNMRVYRGTMDQQADPKIVAVEGTDHVPAYRGIAYVVLEDLDLSQFGNRVPVFNFEVMRPSQDGTAPEASGLADQVRAVALIPGTGEYSLATTPVNFSPEYAEQVSTNVNTPSGMTDFDTSMTALTGEMPNSKSALLVVSWFGDDLRCNACQIVPKVEQIEIDGEEMPWTVSSETRATAQVVSRVDDRPVYGGTPSDQAVVEAITGMKARGIDTVFYPFILMEQLADNGLPDPWTGDANQAALPWRGRITSSVAATQPGGPVGTAAADTEIAQFMGQAAVSDFSMSETTVNYSGADEWRYRRFILHYAHLCAAAGGVAAFCIGSEMRGLTQIQGAGGTYPAVEALKVLAAEVRGILGPDCKISYAADWSEYHGHQPVGTSDKIFHLDPLWADPNIDFIGIDNYMPLSDWRDGHDHADASAGSIYDLDYLKSNVAGGEGYDWFYHSPEARDAQIRTPITDGDGEPWVWRYKDLHGWWANTHHNRIGGQRTAAPTQWLPQSKPFWFTELGCAAIDKGTNQPNKFLDPKSSESKLPRYSNGIRDDFIQMQYLRAIYSHYADEANNPVSVEFDAPMVDMDRAHVWAWDARPFPYFPSATSLWSDGDNYARGHWLNGRSSARPLADVVAEVCERSGVTEYDVSRLFGVVRGFVADRITTARSELQPLVLAYGIEVVERNGALYFSNRDGRVDHDLTEANLAHDAERQTPLTLTRAPEAEMVGRVQLGFVDAEGDYESQFSEAVLPDERSYGIGRSEVPLSLTRGEGARTASRWLQEARMANDTAAFAFPPSQNDVKSGDVVRLQTADHIGSYRIDRLEAAGIRLANATRVDEELYLPQQLFEEGATLAPHVGPTPVEMLFMDLPLITGDEHLTDPHVAASARPWPGAVALYSSASDAGYVLQDVVNRRSIIGRLKTPLKVGPLGNWDRQDGVEIKLVSGQLQSISQLDLFAGGNVLAIGDGTPDNWEIIQFEQAEPVGQRRYVIRNLLRGQAGTFWAGRTAWPAGSYAVLLDHRPRQIVVPSAFRGLERNYRYGPSRRPVSDPSYKHEVLAFSGNGLRPYPVNHLVAKKQGNAVEFDWIRGTRQGGDNWANEVPLAEAFEQYQVQVLQNGQVVRQETVTTSGWSYPDANRSADTSGGAYRIEVRQLSDSFGAGPAVGLNIAAVS